MKIQLVHNDDFRWAATLRAEELKKRWTDDEVDIVNAKTLLDGGKYDVIHFLYSGGITKSLDYILYYKDKVFTTLASQRTLDCKFDRLAPLLEIYSSTVCCVAQNLTLAAKLMAMIAQTNVVYIPNGVDVKLFKKKFVVGYVGAKGSSEYKGLDIIKEACEKTGLELRVCYEKDREHEEMPEFYNSIDCLAVASLNEGCNNPILEALAMNKAVITTRTGIAPDLNNVIVVDRDVESFVEALRRLSGRIQVLEKYTWDIISKQYYK